MRLFALIPACALCFAASKPRPWSFEPVRRPALPQSTAPNPVDRFILAKLKQLGIEPSPQASRTTLLRRVYLDLTGLLPTPEQSAAFLADTRPDAYEKLVDELLRSPHYGEKWARYWLDLARYADSEGGVQDYPRPYAWRYRQWVIDAFNSDMPFDRFTIEQVAGDLLPHPTLDQKIATGFHRNTVTSREGGIDLEKLRYDQLVDRANTIGTAWLGLTIGCAQCHDHKYDPITRNDFYRLYAFFENGVELDLDAAVPGEIGQYRRYVPEFRSQRNMLLEDYKIAPIQAEWESNLRFAAANPGKRTDWDAAYDSFTKLVDHAHKILHKAPESRTVREQDALTDAFAKYASTAIGKKRYDELKIKELEQKLAALWDKYPPLSIAMTLAEDGNRLPTNIRYRGGYKDKGPVVEPGTPESLPPLPSGEHANRLTLARWLVSRDNPLTARVAVNRLWQELFGRGIVRTSDDFGVQGELPTHPELLDWLAAEFMDRGWSVKTVVRLIVTSSTYKQSSVVRPGLTQRDPANTLLARQSRFRLPAELIRDAALQASGLLYDIVGGESVRPFQPEGVTDLQYSMKWAESTGKARYRRGLYIHTQRTAMYPLLMNFDSPDRTVTCARREVSNTPLQALNLMNDPVFVEAARNLATRLAEEARSDDDRIARAFELCYSRPPTPYEKDLVLSRVAKSGSNNWFGAARALLNSDEFLTRE
jgi:hypothetical protein